MKQSLLFLPFLVVVVHSFHDHLMERIKTRYPDFIPHAIVDVGANKGWWSKSVRDHFPEAAMLLVEASPRHDETLRRVVDEIGNAEHQIGVLTAVEGETVNFFQEEAKGNSMFRVRYIHR